MYPENLNYIFRFAFCIGIVLCIGCGESSPDIVPVSGVVTINGKPYPKVKVKFVPLAEGLDGSFISTGITEKDGTFSLRLQGKKGQGCCACPCKVTIEEAPFPDEVMATYNTSKHGVYERYNKSLKYRPIPKKYTSLRTTPLKAEVSAEKSEYNFEL